MIDGKYEYFAFISYRWEDEKMAKWLQKKLEHYKLPTSLREQNPELPTHIRPVFRDKTDLNGHTLEESLTSALESSRYLIVICSPLATQSEWVNRGIQRFIDLGREKDIIPFIVEGEANSDDPKNECFPPALCSLKGERAIYGININDNGRDAAAVKVVSRMFNLRYDALWNRFLQEQKKRRRYTICGLLAVILILIGIGSWIGRLYYQQSITNRELQTKNELIKSQNNELNAKSDSIADANDSIKIAYYLLRQSEHELEVSNLTLEQRNKELAKERDNVIQSNLRILEAVGRATADKAHAMIDDGDVYTAMRMLLSQVPQEDEKRPLVENVKDELFRAVSLFQNGRHKVQVLGYNLKEKSLVETSCFFNNSGSQLMYKYENTIIMYDTQNGKPLYNYYPDGQSSFAGFSDDDKEFYVKQGNKLIAVDANTGKVNKIHCSEDSSEVSFVTKDILCTVDNNNGQLKLWNTKGDMLFEKTFPSFYPLFCVSALVYPHTDKMIVSHRKGISVVELDNNFAITDYPHLSLGFGIHYSDNQRYVVTCSADSIATVWNTSTNERIRSFKLKSCATAAYLSNDGKHLVTMAENPYSLFRKPGIITLWDVRTGHVLKEIGQGYLTSFEDEKTICAVIPGEQLKIVNPFTGKVVSTLTLSGTLRSFDISFKKKLAVFVPNEGTSTLWNVSSGTNVKIPAHTDYSKSSFGQEYMIRDIQLNKEGDRLFSTGNDNLIKVWKYPEMTNVFTLRGHLGEPSHIQLSNRGEHLLSAASDSTARLWSLSGKNEVFRLKHDNQFVSEARYTSEGKYILSLDEVSVYVWDAYNGNLVSKLQPSLSINGGKSNESLMENPRNTFYDPATNTITVAYHSGMLRQWSLDTGALLHEIKAYDKFCWMLPTEDKKCFYTWSGSNDFHLWDTQSMRRIKTLSGHKNEVNNVAFRPHHSQIVSCGTDGQVILWNTITNEIIKTLTKDIVHYQQISFSEDGRYVVVGNYEDIVKVFDLNTGDIVFSLNEPGLYKCPILDKKNENLIVPKTDGYIEIHPINTFPQVVNKAKSILGEWQLSDQELYDFNLK